MFNLLMILMQIKEEKPDIYRKKKQFSTNIAANEHMILAFSN